jgi:small nuclear ribonucleoprotein (snRNP)-like protein
MSRGMIKWAPFASLKEQAIFLNKMHQEKKKIEKPILSEDQMEEMNYILVNYKGERLNIVYFDNGYLKEVEGIIKRIDPYTRTILVNNRKISINDLMQLTYL